ncbi:MAG: hypothetical protein QNJ90_07000 [Planctomycetota bacterium]|nr:hypothetical protein [Planctomycetota bacterium]
MHLATVLAAGTTEQLVQVLLVVVLGAIGCVGFGAAMLLLRVILPGVARSADASLGRMRTGRLLVVGILPLVGSALLARGVELAKVEALETAYLLLVALPLALALLVGAMSGLPHVGARVLREGADPSPLARASIGGLVIGLAMVSWAAPPLGVLVTVLLAGWLLGIGLGGLIREPRPSPTRSGE